MGADGRQTAASALGAAFTPCAADGGDNVWGQRPLYRRPYEPRVSSLRCEPEPCGGREYPGRKLPLGGGVLIQSTDIY